MLILSLSSFEYSAEDFHLTVTFRIRFLGYDTTDTLIGTLFSFNMSSLSVLPKILKLRSIKQISISNIRMLGNGSIHISLRSIEYNKNSYVNELLVHRKYFDISFSNRRLIHTNGIQWNEGDTKKTNIDQFRADEVKLEREYEEKERQKQEGTTNMNEKSGPESSEDHQRIQKLRFEILDAALKYVSTKGWTQEAIAQGAESINYPGVAHGALFPGGAIELIHHFYSKCNRELIDQLQQQLEKTDETGEMIERPSPKDFAIKAIQLRLEMIIPYKETWPQALAIMTLPQNVQTSLAQLLTLVDDICYCAGDRSVDIGWYTRRIGIATIYKMVELYLLQDSSLGHQKTWEFLERRMDEGMQIQEFLSTSDQKTKTMAKALGSAFQTARNILGLNCDKR